MERTKRKFVTLAMCIISLLIFFAAGLFVLDTNKVYAAENSDSNNQNFYRDEYVRVDATYEFIKLNNEECSVRLTNKTEATAAYIPSKATIDGKEYTVTEIAQNGFVSATKLHVLELPSSIKKIGNMAFANCTNLTIINLCNVSEIGNNVFYRCSSLGTVVIPLSVQTVGSNIFRNTNTQVEVRASKSYCDDNWPDTWNAGNAKVANYDSKYVELPRLEDVHNNALRASDNLIGYVITSSGSGPNELKGADFNDVDIVIPACYNELPILGIAEHAYDGVEFDNLIIEYSKIPIYIGTAAFASTFGNNVIINRPVEYKDIKGQDINNTKPSDNIFSFSGIESIVLPKGGEIASNMFSYCYRLTNIFFADPTDYKKDGINEDVELSNALEVFKRENNEAEVKIEEGDVTSIGDSAFDSTNLIQVLELPYNINKVGATILAGWNSASQTVLVHNLVDKGNDQFEKKSLTIYDPDKDSDNDNGWHYKWASTFENIIFDNPYYMFTLDADGGELGNPNEPISNEQIIFDTDFNEYVLPTPTFGSRVFAGWCEIDNETSTFNYKDWLNDNRNIKGYKSLKLKAKWETSYKLTLKYKISPDEEEYQTLSFDVDYGADLREVEVNFFDKLPGKFEEYKINVLAQKGYNLCFSCYGVKYYEFDKSISKLVETKNKWPGGPATFEANWELITYEIKYMVDGDVYNLKKDTFNVENHITIETTEEKEIGKRILWEINNSKDIDLSKANNENEITVNGTRVDWQTFVDYNYNGGYKKPGSNLPKYISYSENVVLGEAFKPGYKFEGWYYEGKEIYNLTKRTEEKITLTAKWSRRVRTSPDEQIPDGLSYYRIVRNGAYIMPNTCAYPFHIEIMSGVNEVYLYQEGYLATSYPMYITIHSEDKAYLDLHLDNFQINAPTIEIDGKLCPQSGIYMHTKNTVPVWKGTNTPTSIPINPVVPGFNPPIVPGPTYPTTIPTANSVGEGIVSYSSIVTGNYGGRLNLYAYNEVKIYGASGKNGTSSDKNGGNGACAIYCENFTIQYADDLYIKGGDSGRPYVNGTEGSPAYGIVCVYSIDEWFDSTTGEMISFDIHKVLVYGGCATNLCYDSYYVIGPPQITLPPLI